MGIRDDLVQFADGTAKRTLERLDGLTDEEFRWQPAPGAWTVRRMLDGRVVVDNNLYQPAPQPMTSVAWRVAHLIDIYGSPRNHQWLRVDPPPTRPLGTLPWAIAWTAAESIDLLSRSIDHFVRLLQAVPDDTWWESLGRIAGPWAESSLVGFAMHQIDEAIHHGAEVGVVRDLFLWRHADPVPEPDTVSSAAAAGRWDLVERLVQAGGDVNAGDGPSPLHLAAANGDLAVVKLLVEHGADTRTKDPVFNGTPSFWARYFSRDDVVDYLRQADTTT